MDQQFSRNAALRNIVEALISSGYTSLDAQAKALGLNRATAWTIVKLRHKSGRLSAKVRARMLANPELPARVRQALESYIASMQAVATHGTPQQRQPMHPEHRASGDLHRIRPRNGRADGLANYASNRRSTASSGA